MWSFLLDDRLSLVRGDRFFYRCLCIKDLRVPGHSRHAAKHHGRKTITNKPSVNTAEHEGDHVLLELGNFVSWEHLKFQMWKSYLNCSAFTSCTGHCYTVTLCFSRFSLGAHSFCKMYNWQTVALCANLINEKEMNVIKISMSPDSNIHCGMNIFSITSPYFCKTSVTTVAQLSSCMRYVSWSHVV